MNAFHNYNQDGYEQSETVFNDKPNDNVVYKANAQYIQNNLNHPHEEKIGLSVTAMILGILSILTWILGPICWLIALIGIILGILGRKKGGKRMGTAGIICSSIGLVLSVFIYTLAFFAFSSLFSFFSKENLSENILPSTPVINDKEKIVEVLDEEKIQKIKNDSYLNILLQIKTFDSLNINYEPLLEAAMRIARELDLYEIPENSNTYIEYVPRDIVHELIYELSGIRINDPIIIEDFYYLYDSTGDYYYIVPIGSEWLELQQINSIHYTADSDQYIVNCSAENLTDYAIKTTYPEVELRLKYKASNTYIKYQLISIHAGKANTQVIEPENNDEYYYFENESLFSEDSQ